ncbi:hypothetical protein ACJMK2_034450 [Sinanodonta woodiana]|uniref:Major facilitator superfamily (MFS) profile domain-containing protein n=1 Tax=Sinanodonta woodiana TaxID=1069815 RepID=A0ABD3WTS6_SINWO
MGYTLMAFRDKLESLYERANEKMSEPKHQRRLVLVTVCIALLLDNMLYMVIVPIIPEYLHKMKATKDNMEIMEEINTTIASPHNVTSYSYYANYTGFTTKPNVTHTSKHTFLNLPPPPISYGDEGGAIGLLFASKAILQLLVNPFTGAFIDRVGYDYPMLIGLVIMFFSTSIFAFGGSYAILFLARSLQGVGSAFADTSGLAMIADRFTEEGERSKALGIALAFISFGCLVAPPFGGVLYEFFGKELPFLVLASLCLLDGILLLFVMKPVRKQRSLIPKEERLKGTPIWRLLMDPYIAVTAGALAMANVSLAFLEPTIAMWMHYVMNASEWEIGLVWFPAFIPHITGVYLTVKLARSFPKYQWLMAAIGLAMEGISCCVIPFCTEFFVLIFPLAVLCFGIAMVDTALLPTLGYLVDVRYVSIYGSVYAIADISYSLAYAIGPVVAGQIVQSIGFLWLNMAIFISNILYAPVLFILRKIYEYKPFENECDVLVSDPPSKQYMTCVQNGGPLADGTTYADMHGKNHLELKPRKQTKVSQTDSRIASNGYLAYERPDDF